MGFKCDILGKPRAGNELEDILKMKGIQNVDSFLNPGGEDLEDEGLFDNIEEAADVLLHHLSKADAVDLLVDCDVDGYTSAAIIYQYLKRISPEICIRCYIHEGKRHGLGEFVSAMSKDGSGLVIVPDAGSGDYAECAALYQHGKEVIILDHHDVRPYGEPRKIPGDPGNGTCDKSPAVVVNNQLSKNVTDKAMTGVGIAYKFAKMLDKKIGVDYADDYLDLVSLGMIGDKADASNLQTRFYILEGIRRMAGCTGKNALIKEFVKERDYSLDGRVTMNGVAFYICPMINSMIRLGTYEDKCKMFEAFCNSQEIVDRKVRGKGLVSMNIQEYVFRACDSTSRKQKRITEENASLLSEEIKVHGLDDLPVLVCNAGEQVDKNFTGLIANRLADQYRRPCLLMRRHGGVCSGSGRGSDKCGIVDFKKWCRDTGLFSKVEGHAEAFGCEIPIENTDALFSLLSGMEKIGEPTYHVSGAYDSGEIHAGLVKSIAKYDYIWGNGVEEPLFLIKGVPSSKYAIHLLGQKQNRIEFVYRNVKFVKTSKGGSLASAYHDVLSTGENVEFDIVGRFFIDRKSGGAAQVLVDDWIYRKGEGKNPFAFG